MDLTSFIEQRRPNWLQLETILKRVEGSGLRTLGDQQAVEFGRLYRSAASDLNQAQTFVSGDSTVQYLNDLVARCYLVIYARTKIDIWGLLRYLFLAYPAVFRRYWRHTALATAIFAVGTLFGFLASYYDPDTARVFMNYPGMIEPDQESPLMTSGEQSFMTSFYFANNVSVSLVAFILGLTYGIGTAWMMWSTGIMTGGIAAVFVEAGRFTAFCTGILPHGVLEIPAVLIAGGAGFLLAQGMVRARPWSRLDELARTGKEALLLVAGCIPLLAAAAFIEAGVARAPDWFLSSGLKLAVAAIFGLLFAAYLVLLGWKKQPLGTGGERIENRDL